MEWIEDTIQVSIWTFTKANKFEFIEFVMYFVFVGKILNIRVRINQ